MAKRDRDMVEEADEEEKEASEDGKRDSPEPAGERKHGGRMAKRARGGHLDAAKEHKVHMPEKHHKGRKHGGKVHGMAAKGRPDRRARGGATSELHPTTAAGNVSMPDYEKTETIPNGGGMGPDKSPYRGGGHRRPG